MSLIQVNNKEDDELEDKPIALPQLISALQTEDKSTKVLEHLKIFVTFLPSYDIRELDDQLLCHVTPVVKRWLETVLSENLTIADIADDSLIDVLKENLKVTIELVCLLKTVTEFILQNDEIDIMDIQKFILNLENCIFFSFKHCKECPQNYKEKFNSELSDLFFAVQELHTLFLSLIESCIVVNQKTVIVNQLLELLCDLSEVLSHMNIKSMVDNWKAYTSVSQKWLHVIEDSIDLHTPLSYLTSEIQKNLKSLVEINESLIMQVVKVTGFLVKVFLKLCDTFWEYLERIFLDIYSYCSVIYSFALDEIIELKISEEIIFIINNSLYSCTESFIHRLVAHKWFLEKLGESTYHPGVQELVGQLNLFGLVLKALALNNQINQDFNLRSIVSKIFHFIEKFEVDLFWESRSNELFEHLVLYLASVVLLHEKYQDIEEVLVQNLLHEHAGRALFALEVWTVILSNCDEETVMDVFRKILNFARKSDFGVFTSRPEKIYVKHFVARTVQFLPGEVRLKIANQYAIRNNIKLWKMIGLAKLSVQQAPDIDNLISEAAAKIERIKRSFSLQDYIDVAEILETLSSINFREMRLNSTQLAFVVNCLLGIDLSPELLDSEIFTYFVHQLEKLTSALIEQFDSEQLLSILDQLSVLSKHENYKLAVCAVLAAVASFRFPSEFCGQSKRRLVDLVVGIVSRDLLTAASSVPVKQTALDLLRRFSANVQYEPVVRGIMGALDDARRKLVHEHLQGGGENGQAGAGAKHLRGMMSVGLAFRHACVRWRRAGAAAPAAPARPPSKRIRIDNAGAVNEERRIILKENASVSNVVPVPFDADGESLRDDGVAEIIDRLKGEVKCLNKALKTDKLSRKNASDLKLLANKIESYLQ